MPPQQFQRLLDFFGQSLDFRAHGVLFVLIVPAFYTLRVV